MTTTQSNDQASNMEQGESKKPQVTAEQPQAPEDQPEQQEEGEEEVGVCRKIANALCRFYNKNDFITQIIIVILLARAYPPIGAEYLQPQITATWICVVFIFILAGLGLKTEEFKKAFQRFYFNAAVQFFNFGVVSSLVFGISRGLASIDAIPQALADGMVVGACLPLTINMVLVLTKSSGGDEASAVFNAAFGNMVGVFLSPVLILAYLGVSGDVDLVGVFYKLALRVVLPVSIGQILQKCSPAVVAFVKEYKPRFKNAQQLAMVFIVYTVFCKTFSSEDGNIPIGSIFVTVAIQFCMICIVTALSWVYLKLLFPKEPTLRVMGLFGCTQKTVAMGVPLINAIYESDSNVGLYTLPLLIWHPIQLVVGSYLSPRLAEWVKREQARLEEHGQGGVVPAAKAETVANGEAEDTTTNALESTRSRELSNSDDNNGVDAKEYDESSEC